MVYTRPVPKWDQETEVVVVGYGLAGAVAAIEAHDAGARVLILEKGVYPGGLSILAGGGVKCVGDVEGATNYLRITAGGRIDEELIRPFAQGLSENEEYLKELCRINEARLIQRKTVKGLFQGVYPLPGRDSFYVVQVQEIPGFHGFPWVQRLRLRGVNLLKLVFDHVEKRGIKVLLSTPAKRLVTDAEGAVTGVVAQNGVKEITIKASRAVIMATGGFEQSDWLKKQFLQGMPFCSMAPLTHTGDGIIMTQKVGAALWHMWHLHGSYGFKLPDFPIAFRHPYAGFRNPQRKMPWIVVDKYGGRYMNEYQPAPQDTMHRAMEVLDPDIPGYSRIPSYLIFDDVGREHGPIAKPLSLGELVYEWSKDNMQEVERGWILRAGTIHDLALRIKETPENQSLMEPETLEEGVSSWNNTVDCGQDRLHRLPGTMMPISTPPFYAIEVWPMITNTQGGPEHNVRQQVVDALGSPIPHLYAIGELGSFFAHIYELAGNLGECIYSGRVAGKCAAAEEPLS
ncbi:FAD-binding protein [Chloroflexota bacterium]